MIVVKLDILDGQRLEVVIRGAEEHSRLLRFVADAEAAFNQRDDLLETLKANLDHISAQAPDVDYERVHAVIKSVEQSINQGEKA